MIDPTKPSARYQKMGLEENLGGKDPTRRVLATPTQRQPPGDQEVKKGKYLSYINAYEPQNTKNYILGSIHARIFCTFSSESKSQ